MRFLQTSIRILKEIKTRPTRYFVLLVIAIVALFLLAYMHNYNIVYLMMFFTFSLAGASSLVGRFNLYELRVSLLSHERVFANIPSSYTLQILNPAPRTSYALELGTDLQKQNIGIIRSAQSKITALPCQMDKRGTSSLPQLKLESLFPLPHEVLFKKIDLHTSVTVYPEPKGESLEKFISRSRALVGEHDDFEGIRSYREGDPLSLIYWPSLAKGGDLMSKEFSFNEASRTLQFNFLSCAIDDESRLSQLTLWVLECEQKGIPYVIHLPKRVLDAAKMSSDEILETLAQ